MVYVDTNRADQALLQGPLVLKSSPKSGLADAQAIRPVLQGQTKAVVGDPHVGSAVAALLLWSCPVAIIRAVRSIVILAVKLVYRRWTLAHIGKEVIEQTPLVANGDSTSSVVRVTPSLRIEATGFHGTPDVILGRVGHAVPQPVGLSKMAYTLQVCARRFLEQTTTRANAATFHMAEAYRFGLSALAEALDQALASWRSASYDLNCQPSCNESNNLRIIQMSHTWRRYQKCNVVVSCHSAFNKENSMQKELCHG